MSITTLNQDEILEKFADLEIVNYSTDLAVAVATTAWRDFEEAVQDNLLQGQGTSLDDMLKNFLPDLLKLIINKDFIALYKFISGHQDSDVEDYLQYLQEVGDKLWPEIGFDVQSAVNDLLELYNLYKTLDEEVGYFSSVDAMLFIAEDHFDDYIKEYALSLDVVSSENQNYFDWESYANAARIDYKSVRVEAENNFSYSGDLLYRA